MRQFSTVFNQIMQLIPRRECEGLIKKYRTDRYVKYFTSMQLFTFLLFSHIRKKDSLRDGVCGLIQHQNTWAHLGLKKINKSTISEANGRVNSAVFEGMFYGMLSKCVDLSTKKRFKFKNPLYAIDATVIKLCLSVFNWAKFRTAKGGLKLHVLLNLKSQIPTFMVVTDAKTSDVSITQNHYLPLIPDSIITFDRAYFDAAVFSAYTQNKIFFVSRMKKSVKYVFSGQHTDATHSDVLWDHKIKFTGRGPRRDYPGELRLIRAHDTESDITYEFLTNNFIISAETIAQIYKARWDIEIFFKWIKQNLKLKTFLGTSENAVMNQIWVAMTYVLILAYIRYQTSYKQSLLTLSRILSETLFMRRGMMDLLSLKPPDLYKIRDDTPQMALLV